MINIKESYRGNTSAYRLIGKTPKDYIKSLESANNEFLKAIEVIYDNALGKIQDIVATDPEEFSGDMAQVLDMLGVLASVSVKYENSCKRYLESSPDRSSKPLMHLSISIVATLDWITTSYIRFLKATLVKEYKGYPTSDVKNIMQGAIDNMNTHENAYHKFLTTLTKKPELDEIFKPRDKQFLNKALSELIMRIRL